VSFADGLVVAAAVYWCVAVALLLLSSVGTLLQPALAARRGRRDDQPPVSIVLPIKLHDAIFDAAQETAFTQDYPQIEVIGAAAESQSEAIDALRTIFARHSQIPARLLQSTEKFARSPKVDNLKAPILAATHDTILTKDANAVLEPGDLAAHIRHLTPDVGLVCAVMVMSKADNFAAEIEASIVNGPHARMLFLAGALGQGFGVGKIMLFRRSDFLRAGGFSAISHTVGEDNAMAKAMKRIGLRTVFSDREVRQPLGRRVLRDVWDRQLRWAVIRRDDELLSFIAEPVCQAIPAIAAAAIAAPLAGFSSVQAAAVTYFLWLALESWLSRRKGWPLSWSAPAVLIARESVMLGVWATAWVTNRVVWAKERLGAR